MEFDMWPCIQTDTVFASLIVQINRMVKYNCCNWSTNRGTTAIENNVYWRVEGFLTCVITYLCIDILNHRSNNMMLVVPQEIKQIVI